MKVLTYGDGAINLGLMEWVEVDSSGGMVFHMVSGSTVSIGTVASTKAEGIEALSRIYGAADFELYDA